MNALRRLGWLLLPFIIIAAWLYWGRADMGEAMEIETPTAAPPALAAPAHEIVTLSILHADGSPASDAIVMSHEPELAAAEAEAHGQVALSLPTPAFPLSGVAYAPGHRLLTFHFEAATDMLPLQLVALETVPAAAAPLAPPLPRRLQLQDGSGHAIVGALLVAASPAHPQDGEWMAFSDATGVAELVDAPAEELTLRCYAPGLPPHAGNLLGEQRLEADRTELLWALAPAYLEFSGPPGSVLRIESLAHGELLPLVRLPASGEARLGPWPVGDYRLSLGNISQQLRLEAGHQLYRWP